MHRRIRLRDVPLPARAFAAWPIRVVLPSARVGGAHGVRSALRRLAPATGGRSFLIGRAHLPVRPTARPDLFSSGRPAAHLREHESRHFDGKSHVRTDWLLGFTPVCGPYLPASGEPRCPRGCLKIVPALGFASRRAAGTTFVQPAGHDPVRIIRPQGRHDLNKST